MHFFATDLKQELEKLKHMTAALFSCPCCLCVFCVEQAELTTETELVPPTHNTHIHTTQHTRALAYFHAQDNAHHTRALACFHAQVQIVLVVASC